MITQGAGNPRRPIEEGVTMAQIIHVCMTCEKLGLPAEVSREPAPASMKEDQPSHGYCKPHGAEWLESIRRDNEARKQAKGNEQ